MASQKDYLITGIKLMMHDAGKSLEEIQQLTKGIRRKSIRDLHSIWRNWKKYKDCVTEKDWYARMGREQDEGIADYT